MSKTASSTSAYDVKLPLFGLKKIFPYILRHKGLLLTVAAAMSVTSLVDILLPLFQRYAINHYIADGTLGGIWLFILLYLLVVALQTAATVIMLRKACTAEMLIGRDLKRDAFDKLQTLPFSYFNRNSVGYLHSRVMSDTARIGETLSWHLVDGVWAVIYIVGSFAVMFSLNWKLSLIILAVVPVVTLIAAFFQRKLVFTNRKVRETNSLITGKYNEGITGAKTTKSLVIEDKMYDDFSETTRAMNLISTKAARFRGLFVATTTFFCMFAIAIVMWYGGRLSIEQLMEIGTLSAFASYAIGLVDPIQNIAHIIATMINMQVNIERVTKLIETEPEIVDSPEVIEKYGDAFEPKRENWEPLKGDIEFKNVSFMYPDGDEYVLKDFNLKIDAGTTVAIVGETGAGKSTIVNLICRFYEPNSGQVLIDGRDYRERSQLWLHSNIGYVLQTPHLFSGSVLDNLRYGNLNADMETIKAAVHSVQAEDIIERMDNGYDSDVGEGGDLLSTGEKQLISFARAIIADPRILVLDEATSSIDTLTEQRIQDALEKVLVGRTSFLIAHRLSTIRRADIILVVKDGKIIESGTHAELFAREGYYHDLYSQQFDKEAADKILKAASAKVKESK